MIMGAWGLGRKRAWTNPYVTDGLVAMWDGEWNAGGGVHDAAATTWVDLTGNGKNFSWADGTAGVAWADNYVELTNGNKSNIEVAHVSNTTGLQVGAPRTVEIVLSFNWVYTDNNGNLQMPVKINGAAFPSGRFSGQVVPLVTQSQDNKLMAFGQTYFYCNGWSLASAAIAQTPTSPCTIYCNGGVKTVSSDYIGSVTEEYDRTIIQHAARADSRLYSIRIYSRALTAEEIAHNYAVDKQRFNLP